jgi:hypothetical protein
VKSTFVVSAILFLAVARHDFRGGLSDAHKNIARDGAYVGRESMPNLTAEDPEAAWFHENTLVIRNDEAILDKVPIVIRRGKKGYSASDGGFLTYRAKFAVVEGKNLVSMRLCQSDYLVWPANKHDQYTEVKTYPMKPVPGGIEIDGVLYRPTKLKKLEFDRLAHLLDTEPFLKDVREQ